MSSRRASILGSSVFQRVIWASAVFVVVSLAALWTFTGLSLQAITSGQETRIAETLAWASDIHEEEGPDAIIEDLTSDEGAIWPEDELYWLLEEEEQILVFRDVEGEPVAGYPGLWADDTLILTQIDHPEIVEDVRAQAIWFDGGASFVAAEFVPGGYYDILGFATFGSYALVLIVLPLSLATGFFLSRGVFYRIEGVSETAAAVARGEMDRRAPITGHHDEFDRLAGGINQMLDRVEALNANIEAVSIGVAHDLKTPLSNIGGRLELIRRDLTDADAVEAHVEAAETYLTQVLSVFDALLRLGEVEAGGRKAGFERLDLSRIVRGMGEAFEPVFEDAHKRLYISAAPAVATEGDAALIEQMLANLLENALEHSRDAAKCSLTLSADGILRVSDDGPGVSPADRERIFERFFRSDSSRTTPGNGLGLSLVRAIADLHGADIRLEDAGPGAVFRVQFQTLA